MKSLLALLAACALATPVALATVVRPLDLAAQAKRADVIVQARVAAVRDAQRDGLAWKVYTLQVSETLAGNAASLPAFEGAPAVWVLAGLDDAPTFTAGDEAVLLLGSALTESNVVGLNQGVYPIREGRVVGQQVTDPAAFKRAVVEARGSGS